MQYFKNGCAVVARKRTFLLCRIKVVMFQLMIKVATVKPTILVLSAFTLPRYSGASINEFAPYGFRKFPVTVAKSIYQESSITWYLRKCRKNNCSGME